MTAPEITRSAERSKNSGIRKYLSFFRIRFTAGFQYRAAALAGIATQFFWGLMEIRMFMAFYRTDPAAFPMGIDAVASYVWLQQATLAMFMMWIFDNSIFEEIKNGGVAVSLCRPCGIYPMWFAQNVSMRLSRAIMRAIPIFVVTAFLPAPYHISLPDSPVVLPLFALSLVLGFIVVIAFSMLVYISAFYTLDVSGTRIIVAMVAEFCSGAVIPLPFLPDGARRVLDLLPFASMQSTPFLIWGGSISGTDTLMAIALQIFWAVVLIIAGNLWMRQALKKVVLQGG